MADKKRVNLTLDNHSWVFNHPSLGHEPLLFHSGNCHAHNDQEFQKHIHTSPQPAMPLKVIMAEDLFFVTMHLYIQIGDLQCFLIAPEQLIIRFVLEQLSDEKHPYFKHM